jgi:hypothetical protein
MNDTLIASEADITSENAAYHSAATGLSPAENGVELVSKIQQGQWIDASIAGLGLALDAGSFLVDPFSTVLSWGLEWLMEQLDPLKEALDWLAGDPQLIETHALTWDNMSTELFGAGEDLITRLNEDLGGWQGEDADAYRGMLAGNAEIAAVLSGTAAAMAAATRGAGSLVTMVREFVRGFIADCVAKVVVWAAEAYFSAGLGAPIIASQVVAAVVKWVGRIFGWLMGLVTSIQSLRALLDI